LFVRSALVNMKTESEQDFCFGKYWWHNIVNVKMTFPPKRTLSLTHNSQTHFHCLDKIDFSSPYLLDLHIFTQHYMGMTSLISYPDFTSFLFSRHSTFHFGGCGRLLGRVIVCLSTVQ
jgi:hypothetical protein